MAFLQINGVDVPYPKRGVKLVVSTVVDSARNANGAVVGQKIGRDLYKISDLEWSWLTAEEWSKILTALTPFFVNITFWDAVSNSKKTVKMYPGDRSAEPYWVDKNGKPTHYRNCKVNWIDVGV